MALTAVAKKQNTTVARLSDVEDELMKLAADTADHEAVAGNFISVRGGTLTYGGAAMKNNKMRVVILDAIYENAYYGSRFDPDSIESPVCFAFARGAEHETMAPHPKSTAIQHKTCMGCPQNKFGSANTGKGKACGNRRRLALMSADGDLTAKSVEKGQIAYLKLPVTSVAGWSFYIKGLKENVGQSFAGVVTEIGVVPDQKSQFKLTFTMEEIIQDGAVRAAILKRHQEAKGQIAFAYEPRTDDGEPKGKVRGGKAAGKARGR